MKLSMNKEELYAEYKKGANQCDELRFNINKKLAEFYPFGSKNDIRLLKKQINTIIDEHIRVSKENYKLFKKYTDFLEKEEEDKKKLTALREKKKKRKLRHLERKTLQKQIAILGYKQRDIAKIFKITEGSVSGFLNGKRNVTPIYKERFLKIGINLNEIMKDGEKQNENIKL